MDDQQLTRYSRHILLNEIGIEGQEKIANAHALVIGAGGLGSSALLYLAASGVGSITICDGDTVDLTNLQRQIVHQADSVGNLKVLSAKSTLNRLNPEVKIDTVAQRIRDGEVLDRLVESADVVIDTSDNFETRYAVNRACVAASKPLVSGASILFDGQISVFDLRNPENPCYECLFPEHAESQETRCAVTGVFAPLVGIIGTMQAAEAIKIICDAGVTLNGRLLLFNALNTSWKSVRIRKDSSCEVCTSKQKRNSVAIPLDVSNSPA